MDAIILAGGFAKRMWPLTKNKPKQLLNLAGKPMLDYVFDSLDNLDFERIIVSVNSFFAPQFQEHLSSNSKDKKIELFIEIFCPSTSALVNLNKAISGLPQGP